MPQLELIRFNFTSNALKLSPDIRKQIEDRMKADCENRIPEVIERMKNVKPFMTDKFGHYYNLLREAQDCYETGLFYATVAMIRITAERFSVELCENLQIKVNDNRIELAEIAGERMSQTKRLKILHKARLLNQEEFDKLDKIRDIGNNYIHPTRQQNPEADSVLVLNLMIDVMQSGFFDRYEIKNGKIRLKI